LRCGDINEAVIALPLALLLERVRCPICHSNPLLLRRPNFLQPRTVQARVRSMRAGQIETVQSVTGKNDAKQYSN
jgi:hypothetical protein